MTEINKIHEDDRNNVDESNNVYERNNEDDRLDFYSEDDRYDNICIKPGNANTNSTTGDLSDGEKFLIGNRIKLSYDEILFFCQYMRCYTFKCIL